MDRWPKKLGFAAVIAAWVSILAPHPPAHAIPIELTITGEVTSVSPVIAGTFSPGQAMTATFRYESDTPANISLVPTRASFPGALMGGSFVIGGYAGTTAGGLINVTDDDPTLNDRLAFNNTGIAAASILTHDPFLFQILLADAAQAALSDTALPTTLPALGALTERSWMLAFTPVALLDIDQTAVRGRLLSATVTTVAVPEPSVALLLLVGAAAGLLVPLLPPARLRRRARNYL